MATDIRPETAALPELAPAPVMRLGQREPYRFTAEQALKMVDAGIIPEDERVELLEGIFYRMTRYETHTFIVATIGDLVKPMLPSVFHLREEKPTRKDDWSLPEPDVAICRGTRRDVWPNIPTLDRLVLIIEVCHTTDRSDRVVKFAMYAAAGVPCYWIVDVDAKAVEVWTDPTADGRYQSLVTYRMGQSVPVVVDGQPIGEVEVSAIFPIGA
jgi:Uma2 family endonuclease